MPNNNHNNQSRNGSAGNNVNGQNVQVKTPYGFVPLPDNVFFPDWVDRISQDIPFSDGISGTISFNLKALTPVFIRDNDKDSSFCKSADGRYFIPATSLKGEIESVLRIMSCGKVGKVANASFGLRDLSNSEAGRNYRDKLKKVRCGWLRQSSNSPSGYELEDWGSPYRISAEQLAEFLYTGEKDLSKLIWESDYFNDDSHRTALHKYQLADFDVNTNPITDQMFIWSVQVNNNNIVTKVFHKEDEEGYPEPDLDKGRKGVVVFTGQPSGRKKIEKNDRNGRSQIKYVGKHREFFFLKPEKPSIIYPEANVIHAFHSIHNGTVDFDKFRKGQLQKGFSIPVFYLMENGCIHSIGLTAMYKYPFLHNVYDAIPADNMDNDKRDLSDCIFGYTSNQSSLKGRVHFGHAFSIGQPSPINEAAFRMSQPRASFYPFYVKDGRNWDIAERIAGWKRYPIRGANHLLPSPNGTAQMETKAAMLPAETDFEETIHFHNLMPCELGALLSAITFHANTDTCFHNIGFGKPLGYGAMKVENLELKDRVGNPIEANDYMGAFEDLMTSFQKDWLCSPQLKELLLMARGIPDKKYASFDYLPDLKDFYKLKGANSHLDSFSRRIESEITVKSLLTKKAEGGK